MFQDLRTFITCRYLITDLLLPTGFYTPVAITGAPMSLGSLCISSKQKGKPVQEDKVRMELLRQLFLDSSRYFQNCVVL